jgi:hypothetical protein
MVALTNGLVAAGPETRSSPDALQSSSTIDTNQLHRIDVPFRLQFQSPSGGEPPQSPERFNPDPGVPPISTRLFGEEETKLRLNVRVSSGPAPQPPAIFNPDPGASQAAPKPASVFDTQFSILPRYGGEPIEESLRLPREHIRRTEIQPQETPPAAETSDREAIPNELKLPRREVWMNKPTESEFHNPNYPVSRQAQRDPANSVPVPDRWRIGFVPWRRYTVGNAETPYESPAPLLWHPYRQSLLKGDLPIIGQDIFLNLTASSSTDFEARRLPTPSGISSARPDSAEFFGKSEQYLVQQYFGFNAELFRGETSFKPVMWAVRLQPVFNINHVYARETGVVSPDPRGLDDRDNRPPRDNSGVVNPNDLE